ncbi:MAG: phosphoesterase [Candidatus Eremiobacteraeota bacterium]|nr:phosphoesterase [Candidatus Eremiobacteraeota bacterium]MBC5826587.1 phosphoesterase [Candidatus Eremiobacteraeota bacterium]
MMVALLMSGHLLSPTLSAASTVPKPLRTQSERQRIALLRSRVKYIFIIYQENRSYDSYFGTFPGAEGIYSHIPQQIPGFLQPLIDTDGTTTTVSPFRIGPKEYAADLDDVDHSHSAILAKMHIVDGVPQMDRFAMVEERRYSPTGIPSLKAKQFGELAMGHEDCDTIPFLWRYAKRFVLFDHMFQSMTGPSTPGNLSIIAAQTGITQWLLHPEQGVIGSADKGAGVPVLDDADPYWGSPQDKTADPLPVNPTDFPGYDVQNNLTFASLPLTLEGRSLAETAKYDRNANGDLSDIEDDIRMLGIQGVQKPIPWGWYEEGYGNERNDGADPTDAEGRHASYVTHHNGPQYFGYIANNPRMRAHLHSLSDFFSAVKHRSVPAGGVYYLKGGYRNFLGMVPADPDPLARKTYRGDDDHPGYSDAQISEALVAETVNAIARSPYWNQSAIIITWDDSEGDYDHLRPPLHYALPNEAAWLSDGPRVPLIFISPYARTNAVEHEFADQGSVLKFIELVNQLTPLSDLPDEARARRIGLQRYGVDTMGPTDGMYDGVTNLLSALDPDRLTGRTAPLSAEYVEVPENVLRVMPQQSGYGCKDVGVVPTDVELSLPNPLPKDFNPRPKTQPSR